MVAEEDSQAVASGAAAGAHSKCHKNLVAALFLVYSFVFSIFTSLTTKDTKVHKGKTSGFRASRQAWRDCVVELNQDDKRNAPISTDDAE